MKTSRYLIGSILLWIAFPLAMLLSLAPQAQAQTATVYAVFDVDAEVNTCRTVLNGAAPADVAVVVDNVRGVAAKNFRVCMVNVSAVPTGSNLVSAAPYDDIWGEVGASVSLPFTRPTAGASGVGSGRLSR